MSSNVAHIQPRVERWAKQITELHGESVAAIVRVGKALIQAKAECSHGEWGELTGRTTGKPMLPFSHRTARRLKAIADNGALSNGAHGPHLPASWRTLAVLASLDPDDIDAAIADGSIHPEMQRKHAEALVQSIKHSEQTAAQAKQTPEPAAPSSAMDDETRQAIDEGLKDGGKLIAEYAERQAEAQRMADEVSQRLPVGDHTQAAREKAQEFLRTMRQAHALLAAAPAPRFDEQWEEAIRLADSIGKQLEMLT